MSYMEWGRHEENINNQFISSHLALIEEQIIRLTGEPLGEARIDVPRERRYYHSFHLGRQFEYPWIVNHIPRESGVVLDAGGGETPLCFLLSFMNKKIYNLDATDETIQRLNNKLKILNEKELYRNIKPVFGRIEEMNFPDNFFDYTICVSVIEHINDNPLHPTYKGGVVHSVKELQRVTKGPVLITMDIQLKVEKSKYNPERGLPIMIKLSKAFDFKIPKFPKYPEENPMMLRVDGDTFISVAALYLTGKESI